MKNPMTPAGIKPASFRFVAQHLNHCATAVPQWVMGGLYISKITFVHFISFLIKGNRRVCRCRFHL